MSKGSLLHSNMETQLRDTLNSGKVEFTQANKNKF